MGKIKLDTSRPIATVFGVADHQYEQDHKYFDADRNFVGYEPGWEPQESPELEQILEQKVDDQPVEEELDEPPFDVDDKPETLDEMSREEIMAELRENYPEVKFDGRARRSVLERALIEAKSDAMERK